MIATIFTVLSTIVIAIWAASWGGGLITKGRCIHEMNGFEVLITVITFAVSLVVSAAAWLILLILADDFHNSLNWNWHISTPVAVILGSIIIAFAIYAVGVCRTTEGDNS